VTLIKIREERARAAGDFEATISFNDEGDFPISVANPFSEAEEARLHWYFEDYLSFPFTDEVKAKEAAKSVKAYGEALFQQIVEAPVVYARYNQALQAGLSTLRFEIVGSPAFHALHWEALKDPTRPRAFALDAPMIRKNRKLRPVLAQVKPSPTLNLLVVTARPHGKRDVGYRTISRPLVELLAQANLRVDVTILRPGTYEALDRHLDSVTDRFGVGHYHLIHFDVHGALLPYEAFKSSLVPDEANSLIYQARYGRGDLESYEGQRAFLALEGPEEDRPDLVEAGELADLLVKHHIPIAILNACQSGMQVGELETSLGSRLMQAGTQTVLAMGYSITVSAAELLMRELYGQLFEGKDLPIALRRARLELFNNKNRRAYYDQRIELEDWLLPVVYQNQPVRFDLRDFTDDERKAYYERPVYRAEEPTYGFVGRDLDILQIEKLLLKHNLLLVRGMGGAGKTTLLHHLAAWWQTTHLVEKVFYFGYDERAWTRQGIMHEIGQRVFDAGTFHGSFLPLGLEAQQAMLAERLRGTRHLLILDNLESITGDRLAIPNTLPAEEQAALKSFLSSLRGGKTFVLLGSRGGEAWLAKDTFGNNVYDLPGLDPEAASTLAERILERHDATKYNQDADFHRLLKLLDGYPLPLEVILSNLEKQTPTDVLKALEAGDEGVDFSSEKKTESIMRCIEYSHGNLSPEAQTLLLCLAPFTSVINIGVLPQYIEQLRKHEALKDQPFEQLAEVLKDAQNWGLLKPRSDIPSYLTLQPTFPYFLKSRLNAQEKEEAKQAVFSAFREFFEEYSGFLYELLESKDAQEKQVGRVLATLEYENLLVSVNHRR
jgi:hypothetical protein